MTKAKYTTTFNGKRYDLPMEKLIKHQEKLSKLKGSPAVERAARAAGKNVKDASKKFKGRA
jgi:uncharacterized protein YprB with RNaseH-like and TPR domain